MPNRRLGRAEPRPDRDGAERWRHNGVHYSITLSRELCRLVDDRGFKPGRVRLARELAGWSQTDLADRVAVSGAAISQYESGTTRPSTDVIGRLSNALEVPVLFFSLPLEETHEGFFRSLRRSSSLDRRRARAAAQIAHDLALHAPETALAALDVPQLPASSLAVDESARREIERIAQQVREHWHVSAGPIDNMVALLEAHGVVVLRSPLKSADVDAFSLPFEDRPVVVLGADKGDKARSRFDAAHELGHLVLHGEQVWGVKEVEKQANYFAAAFLMPANEIAPRLPARADWASLFALKIEYQVSIAALLMRAKTLGAMSDAAYLAAIKAASARGWRRTEPVPLGEPEEPAVFRYLVDARAQDPDSALLPASMVKAFSSASA